MTEKSPELPELLAESLVPAKQKRAPRTRKTTRNKGEKTPKNRGALPITTPVDIPRLEDMGERERALFVEARGILEDSMLRIQAVNRAAMGFWIPGKDPLQTDEADTPFISDDDLEDIMAVATDSASASTFRKLCIMQGVPEHLADQVCLELLRASFSPGKRNDPLAGIATRHVAPQKSPLGRAVDDAIRQGAK